MDMNNNNAIITLVVVLLVLGGLLYFANSDREMGFIGGNATSTEDDEEDENEGNENGTTGTGTSTTTGAALSARSVLAARLGISVDAVTMKNVERNEWSDGCLGLGRLNESCLQAITPGYRVTMEAGGKEYVYRTNEEGTMARLEQ
jgi:hypothetical protein